MISTRVLIVEPDHPFGLSLASLFQDDGHATRLAGSAAEAELEITTRRPDLVVMRAELPDLSGFSLCARLRHHAATARLPILLYSSETAPASLAEHARTPWAANGYLAMPLDTAALRALARRILATAAEQVESADDAVIEDAELVEEPPAPARVPPPMAPPPPPVKKRAVRSTLTDADRLFVERTFQSIADRRDALLPESQRNRPPPRRDLLQTADGRLQLLRDDLKAREAQIARLAEIWEIREREVSYAGEWLHEKDVELQGLKGQVEDLSGRLVEAREAAAAREREHGASLDAMLLEKVQQEKELIEQVARAERQFHEAERRLHDAERRHEMEWRAMEERLATTDAEQRSLEARLAKVEGERGQLEQGLAKVEGERTELGERLAKVEGERGELAQRLATLEGERRQLEARAAALEAEQAAERSRAAAVEGELAGLRTAAEAAAVDAAQRQEVLQGDVAERDRVLAAAKRENERLQAELTSARHDFMVAESEAQAARERAERTGELALQLEAAVRERDEARAALGSASESASVPASGEPSATEEAPVGVAVAPERGEDGERIPASPTDGAGEGA